MSPTPLTIKEAEVRHPKMVKGQRWRGVMAKYRYHCEKHGIHEQIFWNHDDGHKCRKCGIEAHCTTGGLRGTPEHTSVKNHFNRIFKSKTDQYRHYRKMPYFDGWNPERGGSFVSATKWIIENLGRRPEGHSLHIVEHEKGFVPGNLEWASKQKQSAEQMFKIIANLKHRIKELESKLEQRELA